MTKTIGCVVAVLGAVVFTYGCAEGNNGGDLFGNSDAGASRDLFGLGGGKAAKTSSDGGVGDAAAPQDVTPEPTPPSKAEPPPPSASSACTASTADDVCSACIKRSCCAQVGACRGSSDCVALTQCSSQCSDDACRKQCNEQHAAGASTYKALISCGQTTCGSECGE